MLSISGKKFGEKPETVDNPEKKDEDEERETIDLAFAPDNPVRDGETIISTNEFTLTAVATPGHTSNHLAIAMDVDRALFTGDHVMGWSTTVVAPPDGDMADYMASLEKLMARDDVIYHPTHGEPVTESPIAGEVVWRDDAGVTLTSEGPTGLVTERFDHVILACHSDQALALLADAEAVGSANFPVVPLYSVTVRRLVNPRLDGWIDNARDVHPARFLRLR